MVSWLARIVSASWRKKNDDMDGPSVMAQVEATEGDVENVELYSAGGVKHVPVPESKVILIEQKRGRIAIATHDYRIEIDLVDGETIVYSQKSDGTIAAYLKLTANGKFVQANGLTDARTQQRQLVDILINAVTMGGPNSQVFNAATKAALTNYKTALDALWEVP